MIAVSTLCRKSTTRLVPRHRTNRRLRYTGGLQVVLELRGICHAEANPSLLRQPQTFATVLPAPTKQDMLSQQACHAIHRSRSTLHIPSTQSFGKDSDETCDRQERQGLSQLLRQRSGQLSFRHWHTHRSKLGANSTVCSQGHC